MPIPIAQLLRIIAPAIHMQTPERKMLARMLWMVCLMWMVWIMLWTCHWFKQLQLYLIMLFVVGLFVSVLFNSCMLSASEVIRR